MTVSAIDRLATGAAGVTIIGLASAVTAATASAQISITPAQAYCVGTTYTITVPAADAANMIATSQWEVPTTTNEIEVNTTLNPRPTPLPLLSYGHLFGAYTGGDVTFQWTPDQASAFVITANAYSDTPGNAGHEGPITVNVVQSAPAGASCAPINPITGSAASLPLIGSAFTSISG